MIDGPLSYRADIPPASDLPELLDHLDRIAEPARRATPLERLGVGLRLPAPLTATLAGNREARRRLRTELTARQLEVVTLAPSHASGAGPHRLRHLVDCAEVLADLLPDRAAFGAVSLPAPDFQERWSPSDDAAARSALDALTATLRTIEAVHGRPVALALAPDALAGATGWLDGRVDPRYIGLCLDVSHPAGSTADPAVAVAAAHRAGLTFWKLQIATGPATRPVLRAAVTAILADTGPAGFPLIEVVSVPIADEPRASSLAAELACALILLDDLGVASSAEAEPDDDAASLGGRSLAGPMTRVGGAWVGR